MVVKVEMHDLAEKFTAFTDVQAKRALRSATSRAGSRGRALVRAKTPVKSGLSKATTRSAGTTAVARVYPGGPHAHITRWQDQGTGPRHKRNGQYTGFVEPQYMFERAKLELDPEVYGIYLEAVQAALAKAGLK
jgi:hypothetical protein